VIALIHYPVGMPLPAPWQPGWQSAGVFDFDFPEARHVARAPLGTPIPSGATPYVEPVATAAMRGRSLAVLKDATRQGNRLLREIAQALLDDPGRLDEEVRKTLGVVHAYAVLAPLSVTTSARAARNITDALGRWDSTHSCVVIRTSRNGYDVWTGIGGLITPAGKSPSYEEAEQLGVETVRARRKATVATLRGGELAGWADSTPYYSATLGTIDELTIYVRRGPMTVKELPNPSGSLGSTSWDVPVVAEYRGDCVSRHDERVTWSDDASREAARKRQQDGNADATADRAAALALFACCPALANRIGPNGLTGGPIKLQNGRTVHVMGPVRMHEDGQCALALVKDGQGPTGRRYWMALGTYA